MRFPMTNRMILGYVGWLISERRVAANSISQYLSGLRVAHLKNGVLPPNLRPDIITAIIKGRQNEASHKTQIPRMAMTIPVMKLLHFLLKQSNLPIQKKRLIWTVSTMAFHGSFRIHELLSRKEKEFDHTTTLLGCNINEVTIELDGKIEDFLTIFLKSPKEDKLCGGVTVELFSTGTVTCPVSAWKKWLAVRKISIRRAGPAFCMDNGACYTGNQFNKDIKSLLSPHINYNERKYLSHSFRAGMASMMAKAAYRDEEIMR